MDATWRSDRAPPQNRATRRGLFSFLTAASLAALALGAVLVVPAGVEPGAAQESMSFAPLAGNWSGAGAVTFSGSGSQERGAMPCGL